MQRKKYFYAEGLDLENRGVEDGIWAYEGRSYARLWKTVQWGPVLFPLFSRLNVYIQISAPRVTMFFRADFPPEVSVWKNDFSNSGFPTKFLGKILTSRMCVIYPVKLFLLVPYTDKHNTQI